MMCHVDTPCSSAQTLSWTFKSTVSVINSATVWHGADFPVPAGLPAWSSLLFLSNNSWLTKPSRTSAWWPLTTLCACMPESVFVCVSVWVCVWYRWLILQDNVHYSDGLASSVTAVSLHLCLMLHTVWKVRALCVYLLLCTSVCESACVAACQSV